MIGTVLLVIFAALLLCGVAVAVAIGLATFAGLSISLPPDIAATTIAQRIGTGLDSFTLLAIPFFILSGYMMAQGGMARRIVEAAKALVGTVPGGLAFTNVLSCMLFGSVSGSAVAATSAIGSFMAPEMRKAGYDNPFVGAVTVTASTTGLLIPPSNVLIVYAVASGGVSIAALFAAGYLPGAILGLALILTCWIMALRGKYPVSERLSLRHAGKALLGALPAIALLVVVVGGILAGIFTATESGAIAVIFTMLLAMGLYREVGWRDLPAIFVKTAETTGIVMLLIGVSSALAWQLAYADIPAALTAALLGISSNPILLLLAINLLLLIIGAFLDITPAILIFTPILMPVALELGISPVQLGIMIVLNFSIGLCTPPVGSVLFVGSAVIGERIERLIVPLLPFYAAMIATLMLVTFIPDISEMLPRALGLID